MNFRLNFLLPFATLLILFACKKDDPDPAPAPPTGGGALPVLTTQIVTNITGTTAATGGTVSAEGGSAVTARGVAWGTAQNPTTANSTSNDGSGEGDFESIITGLTPNTDYFVRAYATNSTGTAYGNQVQFTTTDGSLFTPGPGVTDNTGNAYPTVILGNGQEWMAANLATANYANGDPVPGATPQDLQSLTTGAWAHYNNDDQFEALHGKHYNWYVTTDPRKVCPDGWHVPSLAEFIELAQYLDPAVEVNTVNQVLSFTSLTGGGLLKSDGTDHWNEPNMGATNASGLSAVGSGNIQYGTSSGMGTGVGWWSTTGHPASGGNAHALNLERSNAEVGNGTPVKTGGRSIRCLKD